MNPPLKPWYGAPHSQREAPPAGYEELRTKTSKTDLPGLKPILKVKEDYENDGRKVREASADGPRAGATKDTNKAEASRKIADTTPNC